jgi:lipid A ethanolaminephosphotransferase
MDVLNRARVHLLWRDNNSKSQNTARAATYQDYRRPDVNPVCDDECRDEGMLVGLQEYIDSQSERDIIIILHQKGNHGPAYYSRYPASFEKFTPVCRSNQFDECTMAEIGNAYDNAVLYTDYFLSRVIELLKINSDQFETAMLYISDHGESLGEHNVYLHGLPYIIAPDEQTHAAAVFWFSENSKVNIASLGEKAAEPFCHDNFFHMVLGLMAIETTVYDESLDMLATGVKH